MTNPNTDCFNYCPSCGAKGLAPSGEKSFACPSCGFSFFINCAAAAMALILDNRRHLLVTRRKFDPGRGSLDLPGGFAEPGEGIEQTLIREIKEELNLEITAMTYYCSCFNRYPFKGVAYPVTDMAFVCQVADLSPMEPGDDVEDVRFIPVPDLDPGRFSMASACQVITRFKNGFRPETLFQTV